MACACGEKEDAKDYLALKEEHRKVLTELEALQINNDDLVAENNVIKWPCANRSKPSMTHSWARTII